uniref:Uncharacterized protein n=1 Tax=Triticum urartu TaxID=4572 RepID=A0A8R7PMP9_TRIUA
MASMATDCRGGMYCLMSCMLSSDPLCFLSHLSWPPTNSWVQVMQSPVLLHVDLLFCCNSVLLLERSKQATIILPAVVIVEEITVVTLLQKAYDNLRVLFVKYTGFMGGACMNSYGSGLLVYSYKNNKNIDNGLSTIT